MAAARPAGALSRRGHQRLAAAVRPLEEHARATRSPRSSPLPGTLVVAHGEPFSITACSRASTVWRPREGVAQLGEQHADHRQAATTADTSSSCRRRSIPAGSRSGSATRCSAFAIEPTLRPELTSVVADVSLPEYLGRPGALQKDVRGGAVSLVKGSTAQLHRHRQPRALERPRSTASGRQPAGPAVSSPATKVDGPRTMEFRWQDSFGLAGKAPFLLSIDGRDDEAPSLACEDLPRQKVVLDSELLSFKVRAQDDFGVKQVGMEWQGMENPVVKSPAKGERILAAGGQRQGGRSRSAARSRPRRWASSRSR